MLDLLLRKHGFGKCLLATPIKRTHFDTIIIGD